LFEESSKEVTLGFFALEIYGGELHLEVRSIEKLDKEEKCENRLKDTSNVRNRVQ